MRYFRKEKLEDVYPGPLHVDQSEPTDTKTCPDCGKPHDLPLFYGRLTTGDYAVPVFQRDEIFHTIDEIHARWQQVDTVHCVLCVDLAEIGQLIPSLIPGYGGIVLTRYHAVAYIGEADHGDR